MDSSLNDYIHEVAQIPLLTGKEEVELASRVESGDDKARDQLIRANLKLVVNLARAHRAQSEALSDLIEAGNRALLGALDQFDSATAIETRFSTFAAPKIRRAIERAFRRNQ
jgi:RNA polymerase primary sigma factor